MIEWKLIFKTGSLNVFPEYFIFLLFPLRPRIFPWRKMKTITSWRYHIDGTTIKSISFDRKPFCIKKQKEKKKKKEIKHAAPTSATPFIESRRLESEKNQAAAEIVPWKSHRSTHPREYPSPMHSSPLPPLPYSNRNGMRFAIFFPVTAPWLVGGETLGW